VGQGISVLVQTGVTLSGQDMAAMMCTASLLLCCATLAVEVHPDWKLLTDFTTDYTAFEPLSGSKPLVNESGTFHVNLLSGKVKFQSNGNIELPPRARAVAFVGPLVTGHAEFRMNAEKGFASVRAKFEAREALEFCVKLNVPPQLFQLGLARVRQALPAVEQRAQQKLALAPHESGVVDGKGVAIYPLGRFESVSLLPTGVPVEFKKMGATVMKFTDWHAGAGEIDEQDCHAITASEFLAAPGGMEMLAVLDRSMAALGTMAEYIHGGGVAPPKPSVLVRHAAREELARTYASQSLSRASMAAAAGGVAGALLAATAVVAVLKPSRRLLKEPLLSTSA